MIGKKFDYDLIVIGGGAAGSVAAHIAARAGKRVALIEKDRMGGEASNWGCVPTKALLHAAEVYNTAKSGPQFGIRAAAVSYNYPSIRAWKNLAVERTGAADSKRYYEDEGIKVILGEAHFISSNEITVNRRHYSAANFIVATGTRSFIPAIENLEKVGYLYL